jgi:uncharacterized protein YndB with AHSA1/START domain
VDDTNATAPGSVTASIDIKASPREVWSVLADIGAWPTWNPAVRQTVCDADLVVEVGSTFRFSNEMGTLKCRVVEADAPHRFAWQGRVLAIIERQRWRLVPGEDGTQATVEAEMSGLATRFFRRRLDDRLRSELDALVRLLQLEAESRSAEGIDDAARAAEAARRARAHE